ncbi:MAG: 50S ribosomal protein L4 [Clostridia bacterium]|nr:50S ribosomal protein L4 [Clostridia bacterium]
MLKVKVYNMNGEAVGDMKLNESVFAVEYKEALIHQVVVAQLANKRQGTKSTLTRAEVRGGGIKPWRQKGTGRARQGSIRSPQWTHGGVVFAPKPRDFSQKINKEAKKVALKSALSAKVAAGEFIVLDELALQEAKTKNVAAVLKALNLDKRTLLVVGEDNESVKRASANIAKLSLTNAALINVYDLVANSACLITRDAVKKIEEAYVD